MKRDVRHGRWSRLSIVGWYFLFCPYNEWPSSVEFLFVFVLHEIFSFLFCFLFCFWPVDNKYPRLLNSSQHNFEESKRHEYDKEVSRVCTLIRQARTQRSISAQWDVLISADVICTSSPGSFDFICTHSRSQFKHINFVTGTCHKHWSDFEVLVWSVRIRPGMALAWLRVIITCL